MSSRVRWAATAAVLSLAVALAPQAARAQAPTTPGVAVDLSSGEHALVRFQMPDQKALDRLTASDADVAATPRHSTGQFLADVVVDGTELAAMVKNGAVPVQGSERRA